MGWGVVKFPSTHLQRSLDAPGVLGVHRLPHAQQTDDRVALLADRAVRALVVAQNVRRSALDRPRLLVNARLGDRVPERVREHADDGRVVAREVVELDRLGDAVRLLGRLGRTDEDLLVVLARILEPEQRRALLDRAALWA